jgi:hypothetical protein
MGVVLKARKLKKSAIALAEFVYLTASLHARESVQKAPRIQGSLKQMGQK